MTFECNGVRYDTADLIVFETGEAGMPYVYMTRDHRRVLVGRVDRWKGFEIREADAVEIKALAARFRIEDLRRALH
jgi:hypothetical protein